MVVLSGRSRRLGICRTGSGQTHRHHQGAGGAGLVTADRLLGRLHHSPADERPARAASPAANARLRGAQFVTAAGLAFSHGANDAQKSMGILTLVLLLGGFIPSFEVPFWVMLACASAITLGILPAAGVSSARWLCHLPRPPIHALGSQLTSAGVILAASIMARRSRPPTPLRRRSWASAPERAALGEG